MNQTRLRFLRGLLGTTLTWGILWSGFNTALLFLRWLPQPPADIGRLEMAKAILSNQSISAFNSGCLFGIAFALLLSLAARRWPAPNQLHVARLTLIGAIVGFIIPATFIGFTSVLNVAGVCVSTLAGAGIAAGSAWFARRARFRAVAADDPMQLPTA